MNENTKEIQAVYQDQAPVNARRQWVRPEIHKTSAASAEAHNGSVSDANFGLS